MQTIHIDFTNLCGATLATTLQMIEANRQRDIAVYQQQRVQASSEFYSLRMEEMGRGSFTFIEQLNRGRALLSKQIGTGQPFMASVLFDDSRSSASLGEQTRANVLLREAEDIARTNKDDNLLAAMLCSMARNNLIRDPEMAKEQREEGFALYESLQTPPIEASMECLRTQADAQIKAGMIKDALQSSGRTNEALDPFVDLFQRMRASGFHGCGAAILMTRYGDLLMAAGRVNEAESIYREGLALVESAGNSRIIAA